MLALRSWKTAAAALVMTAAVGSQAFAEKVKLPDSTLTAGLPGKGPVTVGEIEKWLANPKNHETLEVVLPQGLAAGQALIAIRLTIHSRGPRSNSVASSTSTQGSRRTTPSAAPAAIIPTRASRGNTKTGVVLAVRWAGGTRRSATTAYCPRCSSGTVEPIRLRPRQSARFIIRSRWVIPMRPA